MPCIHMLARESRGSDVVGSLEAIERQCLAKFPWDVRSVRE